MKPSDRHLRRVPFLRSAILMTGRTDLPYELLLPSTPILTGRAPLLAFLCAPNSMFVRNGGNFNHPFSGGPSPNSLLGSIFVRRADRFRHCADSYRQLQF